MPFVGVMQFSVQLVANCKLGRFGEVGTDPFVQSDTYNS